MSDYAPDESEIRDMILAKFDEIAETRTEDRHPVPEFWTWLVTEAGFPVFGLDSLAFSDEVFDLWERANVTEASIARYDDTAGERWAPTRTATAIDRVRADALADLNFMIRSHLGQPAPLRAAS
jgi:hypothetical protein